MAKYAYGLQNVRSLHSSARVGTKDKPKALPYTVVIEKSSAPTAAEVASAIYLFFPQTNAGDILATATLLAAGNASGTARADETTGAGSFQWGKAVYQLGVGYHGTNSDTAIENINWKDLS